MSISTASGCHPDIFTQSYKCMLGICNDILMETLKVDTKIYNSCTFNYDSFHVIFTIEYYPIASYKVVTPS